MAQPTVTAQSLYPKVQIGGAAPAAASGVKASSAPTGLSAALTDMSGKATMATGLSLPVLVAIGAMAWVYFHYYD